jgi:hypothetical protein
MRKAVQVLAAMMAGAALVLLVLEALTAQRIDSRPDVAPPALEEPTDFAVDPAVAMAEIPELREARGSVLAGSTLAVSEKPHDFAAAVATFTGERVPVGLAAEDDLVAALRRMSHDLDEQAHRLEVASRYHQADKLRQLAERVRRVARDSAKTDAPLPIASDPAQSITSASD